MTYRLEEIASITGSTLTGRDCRIERVITDSRNPYDPAATLFVAIRATTTTDMPSSAACTLAASAHS